MTPVGRGDEIEGIVDHAAGAKKIGKDLRPTELLVFGNPQGGTPLMECAQSAGIDLPLKALAWQDASGQVWLGYNDPQFLAARHGASDCRMLCLLCTGDALPAQSPRSGQAQATM